MCARSTDAVSIFLLECSMCIALSRFQMEFAIAVRKSPKPQLNYHLAGVRIRLPLLLARAYTRY
jgi:hypothetical protein